MAAADLLAESGVEASVIRLMNLSDLHTEQIAEQMGINKTVIVVEEACSGSGIREALAFELMQNCPGCRVFSLDLGSDFVTHGNIKKLYECCGLDAASIANYTKEVLEHES